MIIQVQYITSTAEKGIKITSHSDPVDTGLNGNKPVEQAKTALDQSVL